MSRPYAERGSLESKQEVKNVATFLKKAKILRCSKSPGKMPSNLPMERFPIVIVNT